MAAKTDILPPFVWGKDFYPVQEKEIQKALANGEKILNWAGYLAPFLPVIGGIPGKLRMMGSAVEGAYGLGKAVLHYGRAYWANNQSHEKREIARAWKALDYAKHAGANMVRYFVSEMPVFNFFVPLLWDISGNRVKYQVEKELEAKKAPSNT